MANEKDKVPPEGKFAEAMRKSREKRAGMKGQSERQAPAQEQSLQREETKRPDDTLTNATDSKSED